ncbi:hypothetical protein ACPV51_18870 [Vibrio astriarenae]
MKISRDKLRLLAFYPLSIVNILFYIPVLFAEIRRPNILSPLVVGMFFGYLGLFFIPNEEMDLYRYFEIYREYLDTGFLPFYKDLGVSGIFMLMKAFKLPPQFMAFISATIYYTSVAYIFFLFAGNKTGFSRYFTFFIIIAIAPLFQYTGLRFSSAIILFTIAVIHYYRSNLFLSVVYILLSVLFHYLLIIPVIFLFSLRFLPNAIWIGYIVRLFILSVCCFIGLIMPYLLDFIIYAVDIVNSMFHVPVIGISYISGEWGVGRSEEMTLAHYFIFLIKKLVYMSIIISMTSSLLFTRSSIVDDGIYSFAFYLGCFVLMFSQFGTVFFRYGQIVVFICFVLTMDGFFNGLRISRVNAIFLVLVISQSIFDVFAIRYELIDSYSNIISLSILNFVG